MLKALLIAMTALVACLVLFPIVLLVWPLPEMPREGVKADFLIRNVAVLEVASGRLLTNQHVLVRDGTVRYVGATEPAPPNRSTVIVEGAGRYLMPALWDMHTHSYKTSPQFSHPLFIANGVTGVRDMSGCMSEPDGFLACIEDRERWNRALLDHSGLSPRYVLQSSFQINGGNEVPQGFPDYFRVRTADDAHRLAVFYERAGADFLKVYSELSPAAYQALATEARGQGLGLAGHRPLRVALEEALAAGQRSVEHPRLFLLECHRGAAAFRALPNPLASYDGELRRRLVDEHEGDRCSELMRAMAASGTWWTPTLQVLRLGAFAGNADFRDDPRLAYVPYLIRRFMWAPDADRAAARARDGSDRNVAAEMYQMALDHLAQAHRAGVKILAGTDAGDTYVFPGFSMHDELREMVEAGLTPAQAVKSATLDAARFSGLEARYGSIETGKAADMLLLGANPLDNVNHTARIEGLFFNGQFFDRVALDRLLVFARQQAGSMHANMHLLWDAVTSPLLRVQLAD